VRELRTLSLPPRTASRYAAWLVLFGAMIVAAGAFIGAGHAQPAAAAQVSERTIKAAFLYKFAEYVDWPMLPGENSDSPFTIGVLGSSALTDDLLRMTVDRMVDERPVRVRSVAPNDSIDDLQVLFIAGEEHGQLGALLSSVKGRPILTVTETVGALSDGSIINFTVMGERVRFEVSLAAAESSRLRLSSRLLAVAEHVYEAP
jgi:hypothetical protein